MNPCPCGKYGVRNKECTCSPMTIERYRKKLSGPITDRIGMWVEISSIEYEKFLEKNHTTVSNSKEVRLKVEHARNIQKERSIRNINKNILNGRIKELPLWFKISDEAKELINISSKRLGISGRSYKNIVCIARTIADLENSEYIKKEHILESLQYRIEKI
jgi:magnesium chelatase family protein